MAYNHAINLLTHLEPKLVCLCCQYKIFYMCTRLNMSSFCRDEAPSTTTGEELSVKIEEDFTDPPIDESGAAAEDETAPKGENHITTEDAPTAKDNKKATKCLLARIKSSKKGVKKALKKCKKVLSCSIVHPLHMYAWTCPSKYLLLQSMSPCFSWCI